MAGLTAVQPMGPALPAAPGPDPKIQLKAPAARVRWPRAGRRTRSLLVLALVLLLAACARGPDTQALQSAIQTQVRSELSHVENLANALGGPTAVRVLRALGSPDPRSVHVAHVTVLERTRLDDGDYVMRVRYDLVTPDTRDTVTRRWVLVHLDDGQWRALRPEDADQDSGG